MRPKVDIAVIGCELGGLIAASFLAKQGYRVSLIQNGEDVDGETIYDIWGRYNLKNNAYVSLQAPQEEMMDNLTVGIGYSFNVWKGLNVEPNYSMGLKEDENEEREGTFNLGLSYRF